ncbi:hypothetical protein ABTL88_19105, partial [Acinetobacter baumannii]
EHEWIRRDAAAAQREIDAIALQPLAAEPEGDAIIETYTVVHGKNGPESGIVIGRLASDNTRFVSNTPKDPAIFTALEQNDSIGRPGTVS